jgi:hypothetical protein
MGRPKSSNSSDAGRSCLADPAVASGATGWGAEPSVSFSFWIVGELPFVDWGSWWDELLAFGVEGIGESEVSTVTPEAAVMISWT